MESKEKRGCQLDVAAAIEELHRALLDAMPSDIPTLKKVEFYFDVDGINEFRSRYRRAGSPLLAFLQHELPKLRLEVRSNVLVNMVQHARAKRYETGWFLSQERINRISRTAHRAYAAEHNLSVVRAHGLGGPATDMWLRHVAIVSTVIGYCIDGRPSVFLQTAAELGLTKAAVSKAVDLVEDRVGHKLFCRSPGGKRLSTATSEGVRLYPSLVEIGRGVAQLTAVLEDMKSNEDDAAHL